MRRSLLLALLSCAALAAFAAETPIITVLDLKTDGVSENEMRSIVSLLSSALFQTGRYKVIDTTQRDVLLKEVAFSAADCTDESCQLEIGKLLAAEAIVVGTVGKLGSRYLLSVKMLATETAETLSVADGVYATMDAMVDGLGAIAGKLSASSKARVVTGKRSPARTVFAVGSLAAGLVAGGVGGWLLYDGVVRGRASIAAAQAAYDAAGAAEAPGAWDALVAASDGAKRKILWGVGLAGGGVLLTGVGALLALPPRSASVAVAAVPAGFGVAVTLSLPVSGGAR